ARLVRPASIWNARLGADRSSAFAFAKISTPYRVTSRTLRNPTIVLRLAASPGCFLAGLSLNPHRYHCRRPNYAGPLRHHDRQLVPVGLPSRSGRRVVWTSVVSTLRERSPVSAVTARPVVGQISLNVRSRMGVDAVDSWVVRRC